MSFIPLPTDDTTKSVEIIEWEHARIHAGKGFTNSRLFTLANNATTYHLFRNSSANNYPHIRTLLVSAGGSPVELHLYEAPTVTSVGTLQASSNNNRASSNVANMLIYSGATVSADGTFLASDIIAGGKGVGGAGTENAQREWLLKPATDYILKLVNVGAGNISYGLKIFWYEN